LAKSSPLDSEIQIIAIVNGIQILFTLESLASCNYDPSCLDGSTLNSLLHAHASQDNYPALDATNQSLDVCNRMLRLYYDTSDENLLALYEESFSMFMKRWIKSFEAILGPDDEDLHLIKEFVEMTCFEDL